MSVGKMEHRPKRYQTIIEILSNLVKDNVYGPVDRLARATDINMVRIALYEALRYISTNVRKGKISINIDEKEIEEFLNEIERKGVGIARRIAIEALSRGLKTQVQKANEKSKEGEEKKEG